jgi:hypothetical protein
MGSFWRLLTVALLVLPAGAYLAGSLVAADAELPDERAPIVIDDSGDVEPAQTLTSRPRPVGPDGSGGDGDDTDVDDDSDDDSDDDVEIVHPDPDDLDDADRDDRDDDNSGPDGDDDADDAEDGD